MSVAALDRLAKSYALKALDDLTHFNWKLTEEGQVFWDDIYRRLVRISQEGR